MSGLGMQRCDLRKRKSSQCRSAQSRPPLFPVSYCTGGVCVASAAEMFMRFWSDASEKAT